MSPSAQRADGEWAPVRTGSALDGTPPVNVSGLTVLKASLSRSRAVLPPPPAPPLSGMIFVSTPAFAFSPLLSPSPAFPALLVTPRVLPDPASPKPPMLPLAPPPCPHRTQLRFQHPPPSSQVTSGYHIPLATNATYKGQPPKTYGQSVYGSTVGLGPSSWRVHPLGDSHYTPRPYQSSS